MTTTHAMTIHAEALMEATI